MLNDFLRVRQKVKDFLFLSPRIKPADELQVYPNV